MLKSVFKETAKIRRLFRSKRGSTEYLVNYIFEEFTCILYENHFVKNDNFFLIKTSLKFSVVT
ncbi:MAG TPA: hypothetical protein DIW27_09680 [Cytophagales bacterium]|nr:hypothetical protein [Cytophagales bacterium]